MQESHSLPSLQERLGIRAVSTGQPLWQRASGTEHQVTSMPRAMLQPHPHGSSFTLLEPPRSTSWALLKLDPRACLWIMTYTYLSSKDRETGPKTKIFSFPAVEMVQLLPSQMWCLWFRTFALHLMCLCIGGKSRHLAVSPASSACLLWLERDQDPLRCPQNSFYFSRAAHCSPRGRGNKVDVQVFLEALLTICWIAIKNLLWSQVWKHCRTILLAGKSSYGDWMKTSKAVDMDAFLFCCHSWWKEPAYVFADVM